MKQVKPSLFRLTASLLMLLVLNISIADDGLQLVESPNIMREHVLSNQKMLDNRTNLNFTESERAEFLSEMRQMLASIQGIIAGIGNDDRELIIKSARYSGNRMARETPQSIKDKTPKAFKEIGGPTHMMFEELATRAETEELDWLISPTADLMKQCIACHALFRAN